MKRRNNLLLYIIVLTIVLIFVEPVYKLINTASCTYIYFPKHENRYQWLFCDSVKKDLRLLHSQKNAHSFWYEFEYKNDIEFLILEDSGSSVRSIPEIKLEKNVSLDNFPKIQSTYTTIESYNLTTSLIECRNNLQNYILRLDQDSELLADDKKQNVYHYFFCRLGNMAILNDRNEIQILFKAASISFLCNVLFYKKDNSNFLIFFYSKNGELVPGLQDRFLKLQP